MGFRLRRELDLTGAGPGDQDRLPCEAELRPRTSASTCGSGADTSTGMPAVDHGQWSRVELDLDMAHWTAPREVPWGKVTSLSIYSQGFRCKDEYMILDGFSASVGGRSPGCGRAARSQARHAGPSPTRPTRRGISATTTRRGPSPKPPARSSAGGTREPASVPGPRRGQIPPGGHRANRHRREKDDKVDAGGVLRRGTDRRTVCTNAAVPTLTIRKEYRLDGLRLFKKTTFTSRAAHGSSSPSTRRSLSRPATVTGASTWARGTWARSYPRRIISEWQKALHYQNTSKGMLLHQPAKTYSFAHIRTRLDGQFVWPWFSGAVSGYNERMNMLSYTPDGWDMSLGTSPLDPGASTSYEEYVAILPGGWYEFLVGLLPFPAGSAGGPGRDPARAGLDEGREGLHRRRPVRHTARQAARRGDGRRLHHGARRVRGQPGRLLPRGGPRRGARRVHHRAGVEGHGSTSQGAFAARQGRASTSGSPRRPTKPRILKKHPEWFRWKDKRGDELTTFPGHGIELRHAALHPGVLPGNAASVRPGAAATSTSTSSTWTTPRP